MSKENVLLIDGSALAFLHGNKENYVETLSEHFEKLCDEGNTDKYVIFTEDSKTNFRLGEAVTDVYKGHRKEKKHLIAEYLPFLNNVFGEIKKTYKPTKILGAENDDAISLTANAMKKEGIYNPIICGDDSDLLQITGSHYKLKKNVKLEIPEEGFVYLDDKGNLISSGKFAVYSKILKGASKENYKGIPGYGPKKVYNILKELKTEEQMLEASMNAFVNELGEEEGIKRFKEGFRLCYLLENNIYFKMPQIQIFNNMPEKIKRFTINVKPI